jgi:hypothetical protein
MASKLLAWAAAMPAGMGMGPRSTTLKVARSGGAAGPLHTAFAGPGRSGRCQTSIASKAPKHNSASNKRHIAERTDCKNNDKTDAPNG